MLNISKGKFHVVLHTWFLFGNARPLAIRPPSGTNAFYWVVSATWHVCAMKSSLLVRLVPNIWILLDVTLWLPQLKPFLFKTLNFQPKWKNSDQLPYDAGQISKISHRKGCRVILNHHILFFFFVVFALYLTTSWLKSWGIECDTF